MGERYTYCPRCDPPPPKPPAYHRPIMVTIATRCAACATKLRVVHFRPDVEAAGQGVLDAMPPVRKARGPAVAKVGGVIYRRPS